MKIIISIATIYIFFYSASYSHNEIKNFKNYLGAIIVQFFGLLQLLYTNIVIYLV